MNYERTWVLLYRNVGMDAINMEDVMISEVCNLCKFLTELSSKRSKISICSKEEADTLIRYLPSLLYMISVHPSAMALVILSHIYLPLLFSGVTIIDNLGNALVSNCFS